MEVILYIWPQKRGVYINFVIKNLKSNNQYFRSDWSSVRTKLIKLHNKFGMVTDCSFIKLPVEGNGTDDLASDKVNLRFAFAV
jgi:hypothetical protein